MDNDIVERRVVFPRVVAGILGFIAIGAGCVGAYQHQLYLGGGTLNYLAVAAPLVSLGAAISTSLAKWEWRQPQGGLLGPFLCVLLLGMGGWYLLGVHAEQAHQLKAKTQAENNAMILAASRAAEDLDKLKRELDGLAQAKATAQARGESCEKSVQCRAVLIRGKELQSRILSTEADLAEKQAKSQSAAPFQTPPWLLAVALELMAWAFLTIAFGGSWETRKRITTVERKMGLIKRIFLNWQIDAKTGEPVPAAKT